MDAMFLRLPTSKEEIMLEVFSELCVSRFVQLCKFKN